MNRGDSWAGEVCGECLGKEDSCEGGAEPDPAALVQTDTASGKNH